jgi:hypothetical protein
MGGLRLEPAHWCRKVRLHDTVDFWRVSAVTPAEFMQLSAEMRLPGDAWLEWRLGEGGGGRQLEQTADFRHRDNLDIRLMAARRAALGVGSSSGRSAAASGRRTRRRVDGSTW